MSQKPKTAPIAAKRKQQPSARPKKPKSTVVVKLQKDTRRPIAEYKLDSKMSAQSRAALACMLNPERSILANYPDDVNRARSIFRQVMNYTYTVQADGSGSVVVRADSFLPMQTYTAVAGGVATATVNPCQASITASYDTIRVTGLCVRVSNNGQLGAQQGNICVAPIRKYTDDFAAFPADWTAATNKSAAYTGPATGEACYRGVPLSGRVLGEFGAVGSARASGFVWGLYIAFNNCGNATPFNISITHITEAVPKNQAVPRASVDAAGDVELVVSKASDYDRWPLTVWFKPTGYSLAPIMQGAIAAQLQPH